MNNLWIDCSREAHYFYDGKCLYCLAPEGETVSASQPPTASESAESEDSLRNKQDKNARQSYT